MITRLLESKTYSDNFKNKSASFYFSFIEIEALVKGFEKVIIKHIDLQTEEVRYIEAETSVFLGSLNPFYGEDYSGFFFRY